MDSWFYTTAEWEALPEVNASGSSNVRPNYVDPTRNMKSYLESLGFGQYFDDAEAWEAFVVLAKAQNRDSWDPRMTAEAINAYIRAGFAVQ